jgi:hypothetical protein
MVTTKSTQESPDYIPSKAEQVLSDIEFYSNIFATLIFNIFIMVFFVFKETLVQKPALKWVLFALVMITNSGKLLKIVKDIIKARRLGKDYSLDTSMSSINTIGSLVAPILMIKSI